MLFTINYKLKHFHIDCRLGILPYANPPLCLKFRAVVKDVHIPYIYSASSLMTSMTTQQTEGFAI